MLTEFLNKILSLDKPVITKVGELEYTNKELRLIKPPLVDAVKISTLQGLVDLFKGDIDAADDSEVVVHITGPRSARLVDRQSDDYGRRRVLIESEYPSDCLHFPFGKWMGPEDFIIAAQVGFQRVKIEGEDGEFARDLDYVLRAASSIAAEAIQTSDDDGISQKVAMRSGVVLKDQQNLRSRVNLAPYRTFAEIDQPVSLFIFRARTVGDGIQLALFEGDGGRWRLSAVDLIRQWFVEKLPNLTIVS